jgi:hypothetical protein
MIVLRLHREAAQKAIKQIQWLKSGSDIALLRSAWAHCQTIRRPVIQPFRLCFDAPKRRKGVIAGLGILRLEPYRPAANPYARHFREKKSKLLNTPPVS